MTSRISGEASNSYLRSASGEDCVVKTEYLVVPVVADFEECKGRRGKEDAEMSTGQAFEAPVGSANVKRSA